MRLLVAVKKYNDENVTSIYGWLSAHFGFRPTDNSCDTELEQVASKWLRFAGDRSGRRQRHALRDLRPTTSDQ